MLLVNKLSKRMFSMALYGVIVAVLPGSLLATGPALSDNYPVTTTGLSTAGQVDESWMGVAAINENGTGYCTALKSGSAAPSNNAVKNDDNGNKVGVGGTMPMTANVDANCIVNSLPATGESYDFYFVAESSGGDLQPSSDVSGPVRAEIPLAWNMSRYEKNTMPTGIAWSEPLSMFAAVTQGFTGTSYILTSSDGETWKSNFGGADGFLDIVWAGNQFVAVGYITDNNGNWDAYIVTSSDGMNWTNEATVPSGSYALTDIAWSGTNLVGVGVSGTILTSSDGNSWSASSSGTTNQLYGVAWSPTLSLFVAVGQGVVLTSKDGNSWSTVNLQSAFSGIVWGDGQFVAVGTDIYTSKDGKKWVKRQSGSNVGEIIYSGSKYIAVGNSGAMLVSQDGKTWISDNLDSKYNLTAVAWSEYLYRYVVFGYTTPEYHKYHCYIGNTLN